MAKIFKYTLKSNFLSYPFLVAAGVAILAGIYEAFICIVDSEGQRFESMTTTLMTNNTPIILLYAAAMLPSLMTGREFSEGAVRNKIVTGTTRTGFFMSHLIVNGLIALAMTVLYYIPMFIACAKYFDHFQPYMVLLSMACIFLSLLFVTTLGTVIAVMLQKTILTQQHCQDSHSVSPVQKLISQERKGTVPLPGYNSAAPETFTMPTDSYSGVWWRTQLNIVNKTGTLLPSTGGIGVTIYYVIGVSMLLGGAILVLRKKAVKER